MRHGAGPERDRSGDQSGRAGDVLEVGGAASDVGAGAVVLIDDENIVLRTERLALPSRADGAGDSRLTMPGLSGTEALDEKAIDDSVPVVGTSSFKPRGARPVGGAIADLISKPYTLGSFSAAVLAVTAAG